MEIMQVPTRPRMAWRPNTLLQFIKNLFDIKGEIEAKESLLKKVERLWQLLEPIAKDAAYIGYLEAFMRHTSKFIDELTEAEKGIMPKSLQQFVKNVGRDRKKAWNVSKPGEIPTPATIFIVPKKGLNQVHGIRRLSDLLDEKISGERKIYFEEYVHPFMRDNFILLEEQKLAMQEEQQKRKKK